MTWGQGSNISNRIKDQVRRRDQTCRLRYDDVCTSAIDEFDHIDGLADSGQQRAVVRDARTIQGVCSPCHDVKTRTQQAAGRARAIAARGGLSRRLRDLEPHPGSITAGHSPDEG